MASTVCRLSLSSNITCRFVKHFHFCMASVSENVIKYSNCLCFNEIFYLIAAYSRNDVNIYENIWKGNFYRVE